jgi:hypothetical protein
MQPVSSVKPNQPGIVARLLIRGGLMAYALARALRLVGFAFAAAWDFALAAGRFPLAEGLTACGGVI